jgi:hypothetical protein
VETKDFLPFREQKEIINAWFDNNKEPDHAPMTLDVASAPKVFDKIKTTLTHIRGAAGIPLAYVIRHQLEPPNWEEDPPYGVEDSIYPSYDKEMIARVPILKLGTWRFGLNKTLEMEDLSPRSSGAAITRYGRSSMQCFPPRVRGSM